jgi:hypothetical protein
MVVRNGMLVGFLALAAWGQTSDKIFYFTHLDTPQAMQEVANAVRSIGDIRDVSLDADKRSLAVKGTMDQIALAGWLTSELDKTGSPPGPRDLPFNDTRAPLARIIYLSHVDNAQDLQEFVNAVRAAVDIRHFIPLNQQKAIVMRGSQEQVKAATWLLGVLDQPTGAQTGGVPQQYRLPATDWDIRGGLVVEVMPLTHLVTPQALQAVTNATRSATDIQRCFPINSRGSLVLRATEDQITQANWLLNELDGPGGQGTKEFKVVGPGNQVTQVAYVNAATAQGLQETVNEIRNQTKMQRVYPLFNPQRAVILRGTLDQLAQAQQVIQSRQGH